MSFETLQLALANWPAQRLTIEVGDDLLLGRIAKVLTSKQRPTADLVPLLRHILARESARRGSVVPLRVPTHDGWPSPTSYLEHGFRIVLRDTDHLVIEAQTWCPSWLAHAGEGDPFADALAERSSRPSFEVSIDPCVQTATGFTAYTSPGQRAAIHAVLMARPRATLVITLPTGSGKSLVAQAPPLLSGEGACTVVVVPTVALAIDQERQFAMLWKRRHPTTTNTAFSWHSGTLEANKQQIKHALRSGRQPILFTSPESVVGTLRMAIHDAAQRGYLKYLVIDEAHLVAQWGDSFRPEFQSLAAFRRTLLDAAPGEGFKTVLMTATLTAEALTTIETLFTNGSPAELVASVYLRTEPRYWFAQATDEGDQRRKVLEVLRHAPRPLLLYVTEVKQACAWADLLRCQGHERVGLFHGKTGPTERQQLIDFWATDQIDLMVATSAFGVGIDKSDVRCVVHACVPESLDRYYQEVGRSGRDGSASTAIAVFTQRDLETARDIAAPTLITTELGLGRWEAMLRHAPAVPGASAVWRLDLATVPWNLQRESDYNRAWNLRTVMLLARAGVIALATEPPSPLRDGEYPTPELAADEVRKVFDTVLVRILDEQHRSAELWDTRVKQSRDDTLKTALAGLARMERVLDGHGEISQELHELYTLVQPGRRVLVNAVCSGCPICRVQARPDAGIVSRPLVQSLQYCDVSQLTRWREHFPARTVSPVLILFDLADATLERKLDQFSLQLRDCGMRELHAKQSDLPNIAAWQVASRAAAEQFVAITDFTVPEDELAPVPRLTIFRHWDAQAFIQLERDGCRPFEWVVVPNDAMDPYRPDRRLADLRDCVWLEAAIDTLTSWES